MNKRKHILKWFSAWNDEKEERWLEQMAQSGWHLVGGPILYCFELGAPAQVRYRLDYRSDTKELDEYLRLCSDAGWERVLSYAGWQYFRTSNPNAPEIYTDNASRISKYRRLLAVAVLLATTTMAGNIPSLFRESNSRFILVTRLGVAALCLLWIYIFVRLTLHIRAQKRSSPRQGNSA